MVWLLYCSRSRACGYWWYLAFEGMWLLVVFGVRGHVSQVPCTVRVRFMWLLVVFGVRSRVVKSPVLFAFGLCCLISDITIIAQPLGHVNPWAKRNQVVVLGSPGVS